MRQFRKALFHPVSLLATLFLTLGYFGLPYLADMIGQGTIYEKYAGQIATIVQQYWVYPFGKWLGANWRILMVWPYWWLIFSVLLYSWWRFRKAWKIVGLSLVGLLILLYLFPNSLLWLDNNRPSVAQGSVGNGGITNAKRVPFRGENFTTYSFSCYLLGRTFAHDKVKNTILDAYQSCEQNCPNTTFVLGEIGHRHGGRFLPHRTHQNGLSVDFMTPLLKNGQAHRSHPIWKGWGYGLDFDNKGKKGALEIDFSATAKHLLALEQAAKKHGLRIKKVIFDPVLRPYLLAEPEGKKIKHLPFTKNRVWVRHDDHYHVDFAPIEK